MILTERLINFYEKFQKGLLYFRSNDAYFVKSNQKEIVVKQPDLVDYPINYSHLLEGVHFRNFDDSGVPIRISNEDRVYSNSMIIAYGIACFQKYLRTGDEKWIDYAKTQASYIFNNAISDEKGIIREYEVLTGKHTGACSAMNQGMAASLFLRIYQLTNNSLWLDWSIKCFDSFLIPWDTMNGVSFKLSSGALWVEEYPRKPLNHTLNGALFGLIGLIETAEYESSLGPLKTKVLNGVEELLAQFDRGYWSSYHFNEITGNTYIASMKYHSLHSLQLEIIGDITSSSICKNFAICFKEYQKRIPFRLRALVQISIDKIFKKYIE